MAVLDRPAAADHPHAVGPPPPARGGGAPPAARGPV